MSEQQAWIKAAQSILRQDEVDYSNDAVYGAAILLDAALNDNLTLEEALEEFIANSGVELETTVIHQ